MKNLGLQISVLLVIFSTALIGLLTGTALGVQTSKDASVVINQDPYRRKIDILNWKTFRSDDLGIEMQIPGQYGTSPSKRGRDSAFIQNSDVFVFFQTDKNIGDILIEQLELFSEPNAIIVNGYLGGVESIEIQFDSSGYSKIIIVRHPYLNKNLVVQVVEDFYDSRELDTILATFRFFQANVMEDTSIPVDIRNSYIIDEWKKYTNSKYAYSFTIPSDWNVIENYNDEARSFISTPDWIVHPYGQSIRVDVKEQTLEEFVEEYDNLDVLDDGAQLTRIVEQRDLILNDYDATFLRGINGFGIDKLFYFIEYNGVSYILSHSDTNRNVNVKEIIESFEILD